MCESRALADLSREAVSGIGGLLEDVWLRIVPHLWGICLGRGALFYPECLNTVMEQSETQLSSSSWQMALWGSCMCASLPTFGRGFWSVEGGGAAEFGEEERRWRSVGRGQRRHSWWDPHSNQLLPQKGSSAACRPPALTPPFSSPSVLPPPADSAQLFQAFYSSPLPLCSLTPKDRNKKTPSAFTNKCAGTWPSIHTHKQHRSNPGESVIQ